MPPSDRNTQPTLLLVIHALHGGGAERQMACLASGMSHHFTSYLATYAPPDPSDYPLDPQVRRIDLGEPSDSASPIPSGWVRGVLANRRRIQALRRCAVRCRADAVVSFCDTNNILTGLALGGRMPVALCERSDPSRQRLSRVWEFLRDRAYPKTTCIVSQTQSVTAMLQSRYPQMASRAWYTIPSAIHVPAMDPATLQAQRARAATKRLLFVGRLSREKRIDRLLRAWSAIAPQRLPWRLRLVGDGPEKGTLTELARSLGIEDRVDFAGWTSDVWSELASAHAFALTSEYEGFPQSVLEAMASGLPIVAWDCSAAIPEALGGAIAGGEAMERTAAGWIVRNEDALSRALAEVTSYDADLQSIGGSALERSNTYRWERIEPQWVGLVEAMLAQRKIV
ncbi:MAG: glycosyltransferase [Pirellula sp.]